MSKPAAKPSWLAGVLAGLALRSGIGYVAAAYSVSRWLTRATRGKPGRTPAELGIPWELLRCRTDDGFRLTGWVVTPPLPRATVLLCHGIHNNRGQTLERTAFLTAAGYRCLAFDHRAHGQSQGRRTSFGYFESRDVAAALALARERWPAQPVAALGISMGAAALCFAASHTRRCDAIILESLYHDIGGAFSNRIGAGYPAWFSRLSRGVVWMTERRLRVRVAQLAPADYVSALAPAPVLFLTGTEDTHAPPEDSHRLYERCRGPRELWLVPGAAHQDVYEKGGSAYRQRVLAFLDRWLPVGMTR